MEPDQVSGTNQSLTLLHSATLGLIDLSVEECILDLWSTGAVSTWGYTQSQSAITGTKSPGTINGKNQCPILHNFQFPLAPGLTRHTLM